MNASPGKHRVKCREGGFSASYPSRKRSVQCGPVAFVGDDQFIEDSFRHRSAGHRFRQGDGLPQFLVTALNPRQPPVSQLPPAAPSTLSGMTDFPHRQRFRTINAHRAGDFHHRRLIEVGDGSVVLDDQQHPLRVLKAMAQARSTIKVAWAPAWKCAPSAVPRRVISRAISKTSFSRPAITSLARVNSGRNAPLHSPGRDSISDRC